MGCLFCYVRSDNGLPVPRPVWWYRGERQDAVNSLLRTDARVLKVLDPVASATEYRNLIAVFQAQLSVTDRAELIKPLKSTIIELEKEFAKFRGEGRPYRDEAGNYIGEPKGIRVEAVASVPNDFGRDLYLGIYLYGEEVEIGVYPSEIDAYHGLSQQALEEIGNEPDSHQVSAAMVDRYKAADYVGVVDLFNERPGRRMSVTKIDKENASLSVRKMTDEEVERYAVAKEMT